MSAALTMGDVEVRAAVADDVERIANLRWSWLTDDGAAPDVLDRDEFVDLFVRWVLDHAGTHTWFVAVSDDAETPGGVVIGMACLATTPRVPSPRAVDRRTGDVQSVYVVPSARNLGVGGRLVDALLADARRQGVERVVVHSSSGAISAYARAGFRSHDRIRDLRL